MPVQEPPSLYAWRRFLSPWQGLQEVEVHNHFSITSPVWELLCKTTLPTASNITDATSSRLHLPRRNIMSFLEHITPTEAMTAYFTHVAVAYAVDTLNTSDV